MPLPATHRGQLCDAALLRCSRETSRWQRSANRCALRVKSLDCPAKEYPVLKQNGTEEDTDGIQEGYANFNGFGAHFYHPLSPSGYNFVFNKHINKYANKGRFTKLQYFPPPQKNFLTPLLWEKATFQGKHNAKFSGCTYHFGGKKLWNPLTNNSLRILCSGRRGILQWRYRSLSCQTWA